MNNQASQEEIVDLAARGSQQAIHHLKRQEETKDQ
jgi:hypothetical protein